MDHDQAIDGLLAIRAELRDMDTRQACRAALAASQARAARLEQALQDTLRRWSEMSQCPPNPVVVMQLSKGEVSRIVDALVAASEAPS